jgi:hypothetical protein
MLDVINEPIFPAITIDMNVGANSKIIDCLVAKPIRYFGINGLVKFNAVCIATTPPTKKEIKETIPREPIIKSSISLRIRPFITDHLVGLLKISFHIKKYLPIWDK